MLYEALGISERFEDSHFLVFGQGMQKWAVGWVGHFLSSPEKEESLV